MLAYTISHAPPAYEDFIVENLITGHEKGYKTEASPAKLELSLEEPSSIKEIQVVNNGCAIIEVLGLKNDDQTDPNSPVYKVCITIYCLYFH